MRHIKHYNVYKVSSGITPRFAARLYANGKAYGMGAYQSKDIATKAGKYAAQLLQTSLVENCLENSMQPIRNKVRDKFFRYETQNKYALKVVK